MSINLKRMTEEVLWQEYGRYIGLSALIKVEIESRIKSSSKKSKKSHIKQS